ncbi:MAG TPA: hypothetical protein VNT53_02915 [Pseudolysinimonas sp.]|nr:hypothetical protein [Pseudolysinimonas sp.]
MVPTLLAALAVLLGSVAPGAALAPASGSVPDRVAEYVADGLTARLAQLYGPGADGTGIDFDDSTTLGTVTRVWEWSEAFLAGRASGSRTTTPDADTPAPVTLRNEWIVPVSVDSDMVGVATVWINPVNEQAELAEFAPDPKLAAALAAAPPEAALVRDDATHAWFAVTDSTATPLVSGSSGVTAATPLDRLWLTAAATDTPGAEESAPIVSAAVIVVAVVGVLTVSALVLVGMRRTARRRAGP